MGTEKIATGVVRTTHGVHGYLKVKVFSDEVEHFLAQKVLYLRKGNREILFDVEHASRLGEDALLKLKGIDTPEAGKQYNGWHIWILREDAAPLEKQEYYTADLIGCRVLYEQEEQGEVVSIVEGAQAELLEIRKRDSGQLAYLPFMNVYIQSVDVHQKHITLRNTWIIE